MKPLFSKNSLMVLEAFTFTKTLYAFDFDGTLAKIVSDPDAAYLSKTTEELLLRLSESAAIAIVSGRGKSDLKKRLGKLKPDFIIGNHGLEGIKSNEDSLHKAKQTCEKWKSFLTPENLGPGTELEDKTYSLTLHYRKSRTKKETFKKITEVIQHLKPTPQLIHGKCVVNILPKDSPHKGMALMEVLKMNQFEHAFYIGDDVTDEDVFRLPEKNIFSVRVGNKKQSEARYYIENQKDINELLKLLIVYHGNKTKMKDEEIRA